MQEQIAKILVAFRESYMDIRNKQLSIQDECEQNGLLIATTTFQIIQSLASTPEEALLLSDEEISEVISQALPPDRPKHLPVFCFGVNEVTKAQLAKVSAVYEAKLAQCASEQLKYIDSLIEQNQKDVKLAKQEAESKLTLHAELDAMERGYQSGLKAGRQEVIEKIKPSIEALKGYEFDGVFDSSNLIKDVQSLLFAYKQMEG